jgi:hypothetical protein
LHLENQLPSQTEAAEKPDSEEVFIELEIDGSLMESMDDLAAELKQFAVQDLETQEELEEIEQEIDLHLLPFPSASFREVVEYCLSGHPDSIRSQRFIWPNLVLSRGSES